MLKIKTQKNVVLRIETQRIIFFGNEISWGGRGRRDSKKRETEQICPASRSWITVERINGAPPPERATYSRVIRVSPASAAGR